MLQYIHHYNHTVYYGIQFTHLGDTLVGSIAPSALLVGVGLDNTPQSSISLRSGTSADLREEREPFRFCFSFRRLRAPLCFFLRELNGGSESRNIVELRLSLCKVVNRLSN